MYGDDDTAGLPILGRTRPANYGPLVLTVQVFENATVFQTPPDIMPSIRRKLLNKLISEKISASTDIVESLTDENISTWYKKAVFYEDTGIQSPAEVALKEIINQQDRIHETAGYG